MRAIKAFGLAALVAMTAMATLGVGTASATKTVICKENKDPCPVGSVVEGGAEIQAEAQKQVELQGLSFLGEQKISCQKSNVSGKLKNSGTGQQFNLMWKETGEQPAAQWQLEGDIETVTFEECGRVNEVGEKIEECTATAVQLPYQALLSNQYDVNGIQTGDGTLEIFEQNNGGQPGARVVCPNIPFGGFDCIFKVKEEGQSGTPVKGVGNFKVIGGAPAKINAEQIKLKTVTPPGGNCQLTTQGEWSAEYKVTTPNPAWVRHIA